MESTKAMMHTPDRSHLRFPEKAKSFFGFLRELGFSEIEVLPTLVRYRKDDVEVDIYHGRQSYEIGAGITAFGNRYSISEIIRQFDPQFGERYRYASAAEPEGVIAALEELSSLMKRYCSSALNGDEKFFLNLEDERKSWAEEYALDVLVEQLRPKADEAFRQKDYQKVVEIYSRIKKRLTPAENKRLCIAEERSSSSRG